MSIMKQKLFILWDEKDGYNIQHIYLDRDSAEIGLTEHYTDFWIKSNKAEIRQIEAISYYDVLDP
jgi:hypothetical protein